MFRHVKFSSLPVTDQDRAIAFYRDLLGLTLSADQQYGSGWRWIELEVAGSPTRILFERRANEEPGEQPVLILVVESVDAAYEALVTKGVVFDQPPIDAPWAPRERYALLRDSEGNLVMIGSD
ncbi:VOC family protein [Phenylobacterium koreense]|uniref:Enzyme related to lactoylglutathione lyase n=1 Tax=Phenylobacterium koreense TaxID=266125 RepID=A0ABV2ENK3_9CAUL